MRQATYTPGPWIYEKSLLTTFQSGTLVSDNYPGFTIRGENRRSICAIYNRTPENEANAALIAAAPDLLETVETMLRYVSAGEVSTRSDRDFCVEMLAKAIHHATGRQAGKG